MTGPLNFFIVLVTNRLQMSLLVRSYKTCCK